jgi:hypothetical protein
MPRIFKNFQPHGFFVPFKEIPCQPIPVYNVQDSKPTTWCIPGVPYEVVAEYLFTEPSANSPVVCSTLWLGLRPKAQQDYLDWVLASDLTGDVTGVYCRYNLMDSNLIEET